MDKRIFFVVLIVALFWIAPSPNASQATVNRKAEPPRPIVVENSKISIKPYVKPNLQAK